MREHKEGFSDALKLILNVLKKKKTIAVIASVLIGTVLMTILISIYRENIRAQQIESVAKTTYKSKQFKSINDSELDKLLNSKNKTVVAVIDAKNNSGYKELQKMFNQTKQVAELPETLFIYQPFYDNSKTINLLELKNKNNFLLIENGKEQARYSFNDLTNGQQGLIDQINLMIDPKIPQRKPIRVKKKDQLSFEGNPNNGTRTSEVEFE